MRQRDLKKMRRDRVANFSQAVAMVLREGCQSTRGGEWSDGWNAAMEQAAKTIVLLGEEWK